MTLRSRLEKLEGKQPLPVVTDQSEQAKLDLLWKAAANGQGANQIAAIKLLNEMRLNKQVVERDTRTETEVRNSIESLITEYRSLCS